MFKINVDGATSEIDRNSSVGVVIRDAAAETSGYLGHVYQGILSLLSSFSSWKIKHVKREYNRAAHELAQYARMKEESHT
uniref:RNase H type-1 domain-containing protein n=1 Tax=Quercus lobata TaxID=97700 RepID=A0A7N2N343_QUELO